MEARRRGEAVGGVTWRGLVLLVDYIGSFLRV
jgi:hypothetical protein